MEITNINYDDSIMVLGAGRKVDNDEEIVRWALFRSWTQILEYYAQPGMHIPSAEAVRKELLDKGVEAAVKAVVDEHWVVRPWMIRDKIYKKVENSLGYEDSEFWVHNVRLAQENPLYLDHLRSQIRERVLFQRF